MAIPFPSDAWVKALCTQLNKTPAYQQAAAKWEGDLIFVINISGKDHYLYMDLWHGECRSARELSDTAAVNAEFMISGPLPTWKRVIQGQLDPIRALAGQLKLKGNMLKIMKTPRAAIELVNCCKTLDTEWPA